MKRKMDPDVAWAAGLFEGEGCISIRDRRGDRQHRSISSRLALSTTDLDVLERFQAIVGTGTISGPEQRQPNHKPCWRWSVENASQTVRVLWMLRPYLGARRLAKCDEAIEVALRCLLAALQRTSRETLLGVQVNPAPWAAFVAALGEE